MPLSEIRSNQDLLQAYALPPPYGSRDKQEGSMRLNNLIEIAPAFEDLVEKYQCKGIFH